MLLAFVAAIQIRAISVDWRLPMMFMLHVQCIGFLVLITAQGYIVTGLSGVRLGM